MRKLKITEHISLDGGIQVSGEDDFLYGASSPIADGLNAATTYVATHRPESLAWRHPLG